MTIKLWGNILDRDINLLTNKTKCMLIKITHVEIILRRIQSHSMRSERVMGLIRDMNIYELETNLKSHLSLTWSEPLSISL